MIRSSVAITPRAYMQGTCDWDALHVPLVPFSSHLATGDGASERAKKGVELC
jgi:hypothetical protein